MLWNKNIFSSTSSLVVVMTSVLLTANPVTPEVLYQYQQYHPQFQSQRSPYYFPTQNYIAVPGRIVQEANEIPIAPISVPFRKVPLLRSYYELETEMSSSPPAEGDDTFGPPSEPAPPMNPPPPPESEPEPPSMNPPAPPPPPPPDNNDQMMEMKPPHHHHHHKVIHKHVSIHEPPEEFYSEDDQVKIIRPKMPQPEKHINIVFIKAPTPHPHKGETEIILPDPPQQKTLVYVLVKRPDPMDGIRVRGPAPVEPQKPQVFFVRYKKDNKKEEHYHH